MSDERLIVTFIHVFYHIKQRSVHIGFHMRSAFMGTTKHILDGDFCIIIIGSCDSLSPRLFDGTDQSLVHGFIVPHIEVSEDGHLWLATCSVICNLIHKSQPFFNGLLQRGFPQKCIKKYPVNIFEYLVSLAGNVLIGTDTAGGLMK